LSFGQRPRNVRALAARDVTFNRTTTSGRSKNRGAFGEKPSFGDIAAILLPGSLQRGKFGQWRMISIFRSVKPNFAAGQRSEAKAEPQAVGDCRGVGRENPRAVQRS
jgi:hypothetical protein